MYKITETINNNVKVLATSENFANALHTARGLASRYAKVNFATVNYFPNGATVVDNHCKVIASYGVAL